jgi:hypothetical protein
MRFASKKAEQDYIDKYGSATGGLPPGSPRSVGAVSGTPIPTPKPMSTSEPRPLPPTAPGPSVMGFPDPVKPKRPMGRGQVTPAIMDKINQLKTFAAGRQNPASPPIRTMSGSGTSVAPPGGMGSPTPMGPKQMKKGGSVSASKRADGIAQRGKTKGTMC